MDALPAFADLASPVVLFSLAMGLFLLVVRSPWPWTRIGGAILAAFAIGGLVPVFMDPSLRDLALSPERLPIVLLVLLSGVALWAALHQALHLPREPEAEPADGWSGFSPAELLAGGAVVVAVAIAAFTLSAPPAAPYDPAHSPEDLAAPWFLRGFQEMGLYFDPWVATVLLPVLMVLALLALPHLDIPAAPSGKTAAEQAQAGFEERRDVVFFFLFVWFLLALLPMVSAAFLRTPSVAGGPDLARPVSVLVWSLVAGEPPRQAWLRELPSLLLLGLYFVVLPRQLPRWKPTRALFGRYLKRLGRRRFYLAIAFMLLWMLVPLKMYGRWLLGIGYFVYLPELSFRF